MTDATCVIEHRRDPDRIRIAAPGLLVCAGCRKRLHRSLLELPSMYDQLAAAHTAGSGQSEIRTGGHAGLNLRDVIATARAEMRTMLVSHCRALAEERSWTLPPDTVPAMAAYLIGHRAAVLDLLLAQPDADDFAAGIDAVHRQAFRLLHPRGDRHVPVTPCLTPLWCDVPTRSTWACPGSLVVTFSGDGTDGMPDAVCDECGREEPPVRWRRLVDRDARLTALELAELWSVPIRTVQRWADRNAWVTDSGRPARYSLADAERTLRRNRPDLVCA